MLETLFVTVNQWMVQGSVIAALGCFLWGLISVLLSPCHMASIPLVIAYVGGQETAVHPRQASLYSLCFGAGLFTSIVGVGIVCSLLGRMLGDVGNYWQILVGGVLVWVALGMLGVESCSMSGRMLFRLKLKGLLGALVLGMFYGIISGSCTFGFIAPILAVITVQEKIITGLILILLFAAGHCLPIILAGSSVAAVRRLMESSSWYEAGNWFRKGAGIMISLLGVYFIISPFVSQP